MGIAGGIRRVPESRATAAESRTGLCAEQIVVTTETAIPAWVRHYERTRIAAGLNGPRAAGAAAATLSEDEPTVAAISAIRTRRRSTAPPAVADEQPTVAAVPATHVWYVADVLRGDFERTPVAPGADQAGVAAVAPIPSIAAAAPQQSTGTTVGRISLIRTRACGATEPITE